MPLLEVMCKDNVLVILGTAHLGNTPGKCSPDKRLREAVWSREICKDLKDILNAHGYEALIDYEPLDPISAMKGSTTKEKQQKELKTRVEIVNRLCKQYKTKSCLYISIHVNAAGSGDKWYKAGGFSVYTSKGQTESDILAEHIYNRASTNLKEYEKLMEQGKRVGEYTNLQKPYRKDTTDGDSDLEINYYVLVHTVCPAVLVECMFQDNKSDVEYLLSDTGKYEITRTLLEGIIDYVEKN